MSDDQLAPLSPELQALQDAGHTIRSIDRAIDNYRLWLLTLSEERQQIEMLSKTAQYFLLMNSLRGMERAEEEVLGRPLRRSVADDFDAAFADAENQMAHMLQPKQMVLL